MNASKRVWIALSLALVVAPTVIAVQNLWRFTDEPRYSELEARAKVQEYIVRSSNGDYQSRQLNMLSYARGTYSEDTDRWVFYFSGQWWMLNEASGSIVYRQLSPVK